MLEIGSSTRQLLMAIWRPCIRTAMVRFNSNRAAVSRVKRKNFALTYPTLLIHPDGSTVTIRHKEPRAIIQLPVDLSTLSESEKAARLAKRKPKKKIVVEEDLKDSFDLNRYSHLWKKK